MTNEPRQHHTTPAAYLRSFCMPDSDKLCWLDIRTRKLHEQSPENVIRCRDYYRQEHTPEGVDQFCLEKKQSEFQERHIPRWIHQLIHDAASFTQEDMLQFIHHIEYQHIRVPAQHQRASEKIKRIAENMHIDLPDLPSGPVKDHFKVDIKDSFRFRYMHQMLSSGIIRNCLCRMDWDVCKVSDGSHFVTSDNPVIIFNPEVLHSNEANIEQVGSILIYPLTPSWCLHLSHPENAHKPKPKPLQLIPTEPSRSDQMMISHKIIPPERCHFFNMAITLAATRVVVADDRTILENIRKSLNREH